MEGSPPPKGYTDFCARPHTTEDAIMLIRAYKHLGYNRVVMELNNRLDTSAIEQAASEAGLYLYWRQTLRPDSVREFNRRLKLVAGRRVIIAVSPGSLEVARHAARNKLVSLLSVEPGQERIVDRSTLQLLRQRGSGAIEIALLTLIRGVRAERRLESALRHLFLVFRRAFGLGLPLVVSSCAESQWELVHPHHVVGLVSLAGIPAELGLAWVSVDPRLMLPAPG